MWAIERSGLFFEKTVNDIEEKQTRYRYTSDKGKAKIYTDKEQAVKDSVKYHGKIVVAGEVKVKPHRNDINENLLFKPQDLSNLLIDAMAELGEEEKDVMKYTGLSKSGIENIMNYPEKTKEQTRFKAYMYVKKAFGGVG